MENVSQFNEGDFSWRGTNEEFLEFVMIIADFVICARQDATDKEPEFSELCDDLAPLLIGLLKVNLFPYQTFTELRKAVKPSYNFSRKIIGKLKRLKDDDSFFEMLDKASIMPSYETMKGKVSKWNNVEAFTGKLIQYLQLPKK